MPARLLAAKVIADHGLPVPVPFDTLLSAVRETVPVGWSEKQRGRGLYIHGPEPQIMLRHDADSRVLAHEWFHWLTSSPTDGWELLAYEAREELADRFAACLCDPDE